MILVIEDNPDVMEVSVSMLNQLGYEVHAVSSGDDALEAIGRHSFDLVVSDIVMAGGHRRDSPRPHHPRAQAGPAGSVGDRLQPCCGHGDAGIYDNAQTLRACRFEPNRRTHDRGEETASLYQSRAAERCPA
jgi:CheY-like chemotaxis protein